MNNIPLRNGIQSGIAIVIIGTVLHAIDAKLFLNSYGLIGYVVFLFFMVRSALQVRKYEGGVLPFSSAFVSAFIPMTIGVLFSSLFMYAVHNWINPDITLWVKEAAIETATFAMEKASSMFDMDVDQEEVIELLEKEDYSLNLGKTFLSWILTTLMGCIPALIIAAITKRGEEY